MDVLPAILLFLLPLAAFSIKAVPKLDFGDSGEKEGKNESPGITPGYIKSILEKEEPQVSPGMIKAVLEVNVGSLVTKKPDTRTEPDKDKKKKNEVLICTLDGKCKLHVVQSDNSDDKSEDSDGKTYKPVIVSDFDVDPTTEGNEDDDDKSNEGKDIPKVPVVVGLKGAVKDDDFPYPHTGHGHHQVDRLPVYYGMKLSPGFHRPHPQRPVIYEEEPHYPPFSGPSRPRTPRPYGKFHPTSSPNFQPAITPLHRRVGGGGGDWSTRPGVYWPSQTPSNEIPSGWIGSDRPSLYWPSRPDDDPTKHIISVRAKMDEDALKGDGETPKNPIPPKRPDEVVIDGKLGSPLDKTES